jgi:hypothetical protein
MRKNPYAASDGLMMLKDRFARHPSGVSMNAAGVVFITLEIEALRQQVLDLEHLVSWHEWNAQAALDARHEDVSDAIIEAVRAPGSNVRLFPALLNNAEHGGI